MLTAFRPEVVVVDRDTLPEGTEDRKGTPQGRHTHALLTRGQRVLEQVFPGFTNELVDAGAIHGDFLADARMRFSGHVLCQAESGLVAVSATRAFLERHIRERVRARGVRFLERFEAVGLSTTADGRRVNRARLRGRDGDAWRGSSTPTW